jgi:hypothetical protein
MITTFKFKRIACITILFFSGIALMSAQESAQPSMVAGPRAKKPLMTKEQRATLLTDTLSSVVNLTKEQYQRAYASNFQFLTEKEAVKKGTYTVDEAKTKMLVAAKIRKTEIKSILTPEQFEKWQVYKQARKENFMQNHPDAKGQVKGAIESPVQLDDIDGM